MILSRIALLRQVPQRKITARLVSRVPGSLSASMTTSAGASSPLSGNSPTSSYSPRYIDIGINLTDPIFRGIYHGSRRHPDDMEDVIDRARQVGCTKLIITGSDIRNSRAALEVNKLHPGNIFSTAGIHPCSSAIFGAGHRPSVSEHTTPCEPDPTLPLPEEHAPDASKTTAIIADLRTLITSTRASKAGPSSLVAFGEFGLDYDRLHYCSKRIQLHSFAAQLQLAAELDPPLPLFLHSRAAHSDFVRLLKDAFGPRLERLHRGGVVHSFTGSIDEMRELTELGLHIGINGCSFKTEENCAVVREVPLNRIMLETDGPWCEIRASHAGYKYLVESAPAPTPSPAPVPEQTAEDQAPSSQQTRKQPKSKKNPPKKELLVPERFKSVKKEKWEAGAMIKGRNEPCAIDRVAAVVAGIKGVSVEEVCEAAWANTVHVFGLE